LLYPPWTSKSEYALKYMVNEGAGIQVRFKAATIWYECILSGGFPVGSKDSPWGYMNASDVAGD